MVMTLRTTATDDTVTSAYAVMIDVTSQDIVYLFRPRNGTKKLFIFQYIGMTASLMQTQSVA